MIEIYFKEREKKKSERTFRLTRHENMKMFAAVQLAAGNKAIINLMNTHSSKID